MTIPEGIDTTPVLVVDKTVMQKNISRMAKAVITEGGKALRPHFKTSKMIEVAKAQRDAGAIGMTCATIGELRALIDAGFDDLLWAHQPVGEAKVEAAITMNRDARVAVALDSVAAAKPLSDAAAAQGVTIPYRIEINTGMNRAGVLPQEAAGLAVDLASLPGLSLEGVFTHEGQLYGTRDPEARALKGAGVAQHVLSAATGIRDAGLAAGIVSVGSTPGAAAAASADGVTEVRPGTFVFMDTNQAYLGACGLEDCAVSIVARVVSRPRSGAAIIDAGLKAMSSDRSLSGDKFGTLPDHVDLNFEVAFEEHGLLSGSGADALEVGDLVRIVPNHVCGAVNMWSRALVSDGVRIEDEWQIVGRH